MKDQRLYIDDIIEAIDKIERYVDGLGFDEFSGDSKTIDAVVRNFEVIGEATKRISEDTKRRYPHLPWRIMAGMRDKLIHEYYSVNLDVLWKTLMEDIPSLKPLFKELLREMEGTEQGT